MDKSATRSYRRHGQLGYDTVVETFS